MLVKNIRPLKLRKLPVSKGNKQEFLQFTPSNSPPTVLITAVGPICEFETTVKDDLADYQISPSSERERERERDSWSNFSHPTPE